jgi:hypothetical protein
MSESQFLSPRLVGRRFDNHSIPLEFLKDFVALEGLLVELAKWHFKKEHPQRKRIPRHFTEKISISLKSVNQGSAVPELVLVSDELIAEEPYFEKAKQSLLDLLNTDFTRQVRSDFPEDVITFFNQLGQSLLEDESIEFAPNQSQKAVLTQEKRVKILSKTKKQEFRKLISYRGFVTEWDKKKETFTIDIDDQRIDTQILETHLPIFKEVFSEYKKGTEFNSRIQINGEGVFNSSNKLLRFHSIDSVTILDPLDVALRLEELSKLQDGWLDGDGVAPNQDGLRWLEQAFDSFYEIDALPRLFPMPDGNIQAEWSSNVWGISLEIDLDTKHGDFHAIHFSTNDVVEKSFILGTEEGWKKLDEQLKKLFEI